MIRVERAWDDVEGVIETESKALNGLIMSFTTFADFSADVSRHRAVDELRDIMGRYVPPPETTRAYSGAQHP